MVLILRKKDPCVHSNQINFPGCKIDKEDENLQFTALRETYEEIGIKPSLINIVGKLSSVYIPPSNFNVQPYVGYCEKNPVFKPDSKEVSLIITPFLKDLIKLKITQSKVSVDGLIKEVPSYLVNNHILWGATAMMVYEFIEVYNDMSNS